MWKRWVAQAISGRGGGLHWFPLLNRLPSCLVWGKGLVMMAVPSVIFPYGDIYWKCLLLDIYLLGDRLGDQRPNGSSIGIYWWRLDWCCFPRSLQSPLVQGIWSSIARVFYFYFYWSGDQSGDRGLNQAICNSLVVLIRRSWDWLGVGWVGLVLVLSSGTSIDRGIIQGISSLIGKSGACSNRDLLISLPIGRFLGRSPEDRSW